MNQPEHRRIGIGQPVLLGQAQSGEQRGQGAVIAQKQLDQVGHDHRGNEVGQIGDHLDGALEGFVPHLREHQRENESGEEAQHQRERGHDGRIFEGVEERVAGEQLHKIIRPGEGAAENALGQAEILEGHHNAKHGQVMRDDDVDRHGDKDEVDGLVSGPIPLPGVLHLVMGVGRWHCRASYHGAPPQKITMRKETRRLSSAKA